jgi:hypothetical protein
VAGSCEYGDEPAGCGTTEFLFLNLALRGGGAVGKPGTIWFEWDASASACAGDAN